MQDSRDANDGPIEVGLVAPYPFVRAGLRALLSGVATIDVCGEAASLEALFAESIPLLNVAVIDLDASIAWNEAAEIRELPAGLGLVLLGPSRDERSLVDTLGSRAWAYLLKEAGSVELIQAIQAVSAGLVVLQPPLLERLINQPVRHPIVDDGRDDALTGRELEVLQLVAEGLPNKAIALRMAISEHTVKFHLTSILSKFGAASRTEAVRLGARRGLIVL